MWVIYQMKRSVDSWNRKKTHVQIRGYWPTGIDRQNAFGASGRLYPFHVPVYVEYHFDLTAPSGNNASFLMKCGKEME